MKAMSMSQPWAQLLVGGAKQYETRSWRTSHRGPLLIHASLGFPQNQRDLCAEEPFRSLLREQGFVRLTDLPRGAIVGSVEIVDCIDVDAVIDELNDRERLLGDFRPGRWAWRLGRCRRLPMPLPWQGTRGLFEVEA